MYGSCRVWSGTDWIEEWNDGMIAPIMKKGRERGWRTIGGNYITPLYKVYVIVLGERLEKEVEEGGRVPQNKRGSGGK